ncbi:MAG: alpha/beta fold hydrolase [Lachnospiraceae bacterium]|nr:alpha/beta fold hydrolase [Lachnospiraceae bacterium]
MIQEELVFQKKNGHKIAGKAYLAGKDAQYPTVIFAHGFGSNYRQLQHHGDGFAEAGINCIFFDFCGGGLESLSDGAMTQMTVLTEAEDLREVIDQVLQLDYVDPYRLFVQGESQGGFVAAYTAAQMPEKIKALVLWYPAFVIPDDSKKRFEKNDNTCFGMALCPDYNRASKDIDIFNVITGYKGPVKIIHGEEDALVPVSYSQRAQKAYDNASLTVIAKAGHGFDGEDSSFAREQSIAFIKENLCSPLL